MIYSLKEKIDILNREFEAFENEIKILEQMEKDFNDNFSININFDELDDKKRALENYLKKIRNEIEKKHEDLLFIKSQIKMIKNQSNDNVIKTLLQLKNSENLKNKYNVSGHIYGTIRQLGKVNPDYDIAIQVAGGDKFNYIIVDNQETAKKCINFLRSNKVGSASFIPLDKIKTHNEEIYTASNSNTIKRAVDLIQFDSLFKDAFEFVFGNILIVPDIDIALKLELNVKKVTLNGDIVENSNLITGGTYKSTDQGDFILLEEVNIPTIELELIHLKKEEALYLKRIKEIETNIDLNYRKIILNNNKFSVIKQNLEVLNDILCKKEKELKNFCIELTNIKSELKNNAINLENEQFKLKVTTSEGIIKN